MSRHTAEARALRVLFVVCVTDVTVHNGEGVEGLISVETRTHTDAQSYMCVCPELLDQGRILFSWTFSTISPTGSW